MGCFNRKCVYKYCIGPAEHQVNSYCLIYNGQKSFWINTTDKVYWQKYSFRLFIKLRLQPHRLKNALFWNYCYYGQNQIKINSNLCLRYKNQEKLFLNFATVYQLKESFFLLSKILARKCLVIMKIPILNCCPKLRRVRQVFWFQFPLSFPE